MSRHHPRRSAPKRGCRGRTLTIEAAGGRYLVRGGQHMVLEGDWKPTRLVIFEFPSLQAVQSFYVSPEYAPLKAMRMAAGSANIVGVEGV